MRLELDKSDIYKTFKFRYAINKIAPHKYNYLSPINANSLYVKYTSKSTVYKMLESDSLYLFCSELSNDHSENHILPIEDTVDAYITCFYQNNIQPGIQSINSSDVYSQWMSYCREGGAAFEFYFAQDLISFGNNLGNTEDDVYKCMKSKLDDLDAKNINIFDYSILCNTHKKPLDYIKYSTFPFQVQYFDQDIFIERNGNEVNLIDSTYLKQLRKLAENCDIELEKLTSYFKHSGFVQECEARLSFLNYKGQLNDCIHFLDKPDGGKLPYIIAKFGDLDNENRPCNFVKLKRGDNLIDTVKSKLDKIPEYKFNSKFTIIIPQGHDQEKVYDAVETVVRDKVIEREKEYGTKDKGPRIICQGHLPITKITLAPTEDRKEQRKMMEIYCKSKYWLRNVEICESQIPYNTQNINHS